MFKHVFLIIQYIIRSLLSILSLPMRALRLAIEFFGSLTKLFVYLLVASSLLVISYSTLSTERKIGIQKVSTQAVVIARAVAKNPTQVLNKVNPLIRKKKVNASPSKFWSWMKTVLALPFIFIKQAVVIIMPVVRDLGVALVGDYMGPMMVSFFKLVVFVLTSPPFLILSLILIVVSWVLSWFDTRGKTVLEIFAEMLKTLLYYSAYPVTRPATDFYNAVLTRISGRPTPVVKVKVPKQESMGVIHLSPLQNFLYWLKPIRFLLGPPRGAIRY